MVCAANRLSNGVILCGARHWDSIMRAQADAIGCITKLKVYAEQGFINQFGEFLTREEALQVVKESNRPFNIKRNGSETELYSEGLY